MEDEYLRRATVAGVNMAKIATSTTTKVDPNRSAQFKNDTDKMNGRVNVFTPF